MRLRVIDQTNADDGGGNLPENLEPLSPHGRLESHKAGDVTAGLSHACDESAADWVVGIGEYDRNALRGLLQHRDRWRAHTKNNVRFAADQFSRVGAKLAKITGSPPIVDLNVLTPSPAQRFQPLSRRFHPRLSLPIIFSLGLQHADPPHAVRGLRTCTNMPRSLAP